MRGVGGGVGGTCLSWNLELNFPNVPANWGDLSDSDGPLMKGYCLKNSHQPVLKKTKEAHLHTDHSRKLPAPAITKGKEIRKFIILVSIY